MNDFVFIDNFLELVEHLGRNSNLIVNQKIKGMWHSQVVQLQFQTLSYRKFFLDHNLKLIFM